MLQLTFRLPPDGTSRTTLHLSALPTSGLCAYVQDWRTPPETKFCLRPCLRTTRCALAVFRLVWPMADHADAKGQCQIWNNNSLECLLDNQPKEDGDPSLVSHILRVVCEITTRAKGSANVCVSSLCPRPRNHTYHADWNVHLLFSAIVMLEQRCVDM